MRRPVGGKVTARIRELLARVVAAKVADRFALRDVCPRDVAQFDRALDHAIDRGFVERVRPTGGRCGAWFLRLTIEGVAAARTGNVNGPLTIPDGANGERELFRVGLFGEVDQHTYRQRRKRQ